MRTSLLASALALGATLAGAAPLEERADSSKVGYLISSFLGNVPSVYQYLSNGNDALSFRKLNGGNPILNPTVGTKGARDPYLASFPAKGKYYMLATDLDISKTNFSEAQRVGSRSIIIWESSDLVNWSSDRLVQLETPEAGYVWAPSAYCEVGASECIIWWSSRFYASNDPNHTGPVVKASTIRYSRTSDFVNFSAPADYIPTQPWGMIDQEFQKLDNGGFARFIKNNTANNVWWETTTDNNVLSPYWSYKGLVTSDIREGPASYADNKTPGLYHLLLDNYSGQGSYEVYGTSNIQSGPWSKPNAPNFPYGQRHGSVLPLNQAQYNAIAAKYPS